MRATPHSATSSPSSSVASGRSNASSTTRRPSASHTALDGRGHGMRRTDSNISSTSSDILVAPGPNNIADIDSPLSARHKHHGPMSSSSSSALNGVRARVDRGLLIISYWPSSRLQRIFDPTDVNPTASTPAGDVNPSTNATQAINRANADVHPNGHQLGHSNGYGSAPAWNFSGSALGSNDIGPNSRGTYSKDYTLAHPEVGWVHRGQGRYLPASAVKKDSPASGAQRQSRPAPRSTGHDILVDHSDSRAVSPTSILPTTKIGGHPTTPIVAASVDAHRRKRRAVEETLTDSLSPPTTYGLRRRNTVDANVPLPFESQTGRPIRRVRALPSIESTRRSIIAAEFSETESDTEETSDEGVANDEDDEDDDDDDDGDIGDEGDQDADAMNEGDDQTYSKAYVAARPQENFHHTGNGWYKRGHRPRGKGKHAKHRELSDNIIIRPDGSFDFDVSKTIHGSQLEKFPGHVFHHSGNGWWKAGPMLSAKRTSMIVPGPNATSNSSEDASVDAEAPPMTKDDAAGQTDRLAQTVSKEYTISHPEIEWVHRGNGRYVRKDSVKTPASASPVTVSDRRLSKVAVPTINVDVRPKPEPPGQAKSRRVSRPSQSATSSQDPIPVLDIPDTLYDKAYVDAHPELEFHHRGQGRYKRGPRPIAKPRDATTDKDEDGGGDEDYRSGTSADAGNQGEHARSAELNGHYGREAEGLVDTAYVNSHPYDTFYHKGQGRWARGLPPPGSSNKTAVRGPGAKNKSEASPVADEEVRVESNETPALTALVLRSEGPLRWPNLSWHYRGGGKWSRVTKSEWEELNSGPRVHHTNTSSRYKSRGTTAAANSQLQREAAAAAAASTAMGAADEDDDEDDDDDDDEEDVDIDDAEDDDDDDARFDSDGRLTSRRRTRRRRRTGRMSTTYLNEYGAHSQSQVHSVAPTPQLPMLAPEDDVLGPDDLPDLYRGSHSPADLDEQDPAALLYRSLYQPLNVDALVKSLTKHNPAVRPLDNLLKIADNAQGALKALQDEYLELERITAPHSRIPRKPAKGGRVPVDTQIFEDKKEAELYDYSFDARKVGFQDPMAQKIIRDAEGRELRKRRHRNRLDAVNTIPGWDFGEGGELGSKRQSRQPTRFDGAVAPPPTRRRTATALAKGTSTTPDRAATPVHVPTTSTSASASMPAAVPAITVVSAAAPTSVPSTSGRWNRHAHVNKRVRELQREESVVTVRTDGGNGNNPNANLNNPNNHHHHHHHHHRNPNNTPTADTAAATSDKTWTEPKVVRKGRPPGSKNLHKRRDAGIKKGPRKPKIPLVAGTEVSAGPKAATMSPMPSVVAVTPQPPPSTIAPPVQALGGAFKPTVDGHEMGEKVG